MNAHLYTLVCPTCVYPLNGTPPCRRATCARMRQFHPPTVKPLRLMSSSLIGFLCSSAGLVLSRCMLLAVCSLSLVQPAQAATTGTIRGRVLNASTGNYLNNVRVSVAGTALETMTNATGDYWLTQVPVGS